MNIAIVTDSTADIPPALAEEKNIQVMPNIIVMDGDQYIDGKEISRERFYERLLNMQNLPTTGTASPGSYQKLYEELFAQGFTHIISIHCASQLSGIVNSASTAAQVFDGRVRVIDSGQVSLGLGFQVLEAAEKVAGNIPLETILADLQEIQNRIRFIAMLDTLEYIRRSGRVGWARASLGNILRIKLFIELKKGHVLRLGEVRTRQKGLERLVSTLQDLGPLDRLAILHTNCEGDARRLLETIQNQVTYPPLVINVTTIIGTHVGPNSLGFTVLLPES